MTTDYDPDIVEESLDDDFEFLVPLTIGTITVSSTAEYRHMLDLIHDQYRMAGLSDDDIEFFDDDFGTDSDPDNAEGTRVMMEAMMSTEEMVDLSDVAEQFSQAAAISDVPELDTDALQEGFGALLKEFSLDSHIFDRENDRINIPDYEPECPPVCALRTGLYPPRPPLLIKPQNRPIELIISRHRTSESFRLRSHLKWMDVVSPYLPEGVTLGEEEHFSMASTRRPSDALADYHSTSTLESLSTYVDVEKRSNSRPKGGYVQLHMEDGSRHNIGTHSYILKQDMVFPMDVDACDKALAELFSAEAGEGLACATGSHSLHQMVNACLAAAVEYGSINVLVECEHQNDDLTIFRKDDGTIACSIDVTSTAGIWHKPLSRRKMAAISKYDVGAILVRSCPGPVARAFSAAIACCLAVEHQAFYGIPNLDELPQDLQLQYRISNILGSLSQKTVSTLAEMSYSAAVHECIKDTIGMDPHEEGVSYKIKAQVLIDTIKSLKRKDKYAFPPLPISPIRGLYDKHVETKFLDQVLMVPAAVFASDITGTTIQPEDNRVFLDRFPADGRYPAQDVMDTCLYLCNHVMEAQGEVHLGPMQEVDEELPDSDLWDRVSKIYGASAVAQFIEVRADVVRAVDQNPTNNPKVWRSQLIYKGKVLLYYRVRDAVSDARGYRVDWFALSAFEVLGSVNVSRDKLRPMYLWPRQRLRSQEMELAAMAPRRLKLTMFTMLTMMRTCRADPRHILIAWQKLALTTACATWASGANFITCRHLSASLAAPSPPFDSMAKKFKPPQTTACLLYFTSLLKCLEEWDHRDRYHDRAAILGLPRAYSQLESYWQVWIPDEFADTNKHFADCVLALYGEHQDLDETSRIRIADLLDQYELLSRDEISYDAIRRSIRRSCSLETGGKFGWSIFGSMASAFALTKQGSPKKFDKVFSRGGRARNLTSHLTVRHSGRINQYRKMEKGTVAEMIIKQGTDEYLSTLQAGLRFYYGNRPYFINHPKKKELKDREISITDPDSRIMLNDAEHVCGEYGRHTQIDMLKRPDKDAYFYRISAEAMLKGGVIQASDASRFAAMMSNIAVSNTCMTLGALGGSAHLQASASVYKRLAARRMIIDTCVLSEYEKRLEQNREVKEASTIRGAVRWIRSMPKIGEHESHALRTYTTAAHTGQGMSHVGMSIEHGGALLVSLAAAEHVEIYIRGQRAHVAGIPLVTSDDSTIVAGIDESKTQALLTRSERQRACHMFLKIQQRTRKIALRSVSVMPNLSKEKASGIAGEFNSQDNGIGVACPVLGYREMICQLTRPSAQSLIADYLDAHAYGKTVALSGLGISTGIYAHRMALDALEQRWKLKEEERVFLDRCDFLPTPLLTGATGSDILRSPASMLPGPTREALMQLAMEHHAEAAELDIHAKDLAFTVLGHVRVGMRRQHQKAIRAIEELIQIHKAAGRPHQAEMLRSSLVATLSSARTRGAGRIAQRVRGRMVRPEDALSCSFQKAPMMESTLIWYDHIMSLLRRTKPSEEIQALSTVYGGYVACGKFTFIKFPQPATRRRSSATGAKKPKYILDTYGETPFGRHVVERSQAKVIKEFTDVERGEMSMYYASRAYRMIPEHVQYGGKVVYSWTRAESCTLTHVSYVPHIVINQPLDEYWGGMSDEDIEFLREAELVNEGYPVLALNYASGGRAHFHGVYEGKDYSASIPFDPGTAPTYVTLPHIARGGIQVVLAIQSWSTDRRWYGTGPTEEEIASYQQDGLRNHTNVDVDSTWTKMEREIYTQMPMAASLVDYGSKRILYMIDPDLTRSCKETLLPYHKAKFLVNIATGGYWYSALRGVCVRAYLKGHCGTRTCWTGPVLGWRMSRTHEPSYNWSPPERGIIKSMAVIGGVDTDDHISVLNPQDYASNHCYVDKSGIHMVHEAHKLKASQTNMSMLLALNGGNLMFNADQGKAHLIDCALPAPTLPASVLDIDTIRSELWNLVHGTDNAADDFF